MRCQRTLSGVVGCEGVALHSGQHIEVKIRPAEPGSGIRFIRSDFDDATAIQAHARHVSDTFYSTTLSQGGISVATVEHLMAAFFSLGVTNADVYVSGGELPILDGSSKDWVDILLQVGLYDQKGELVPELVIKKPVGVKDKNCHATLYPDEVFSVDCSIDFSHPAIGTQNWVGVINEEVFCNELAEARTFGMIKDVEYLRARGRARGAQMSNAIVLDEQRVISPGGLRYKNEFVRHKVLDAVGDLSLLGLPIRGRLVSQRSGHRIHQQLLKILLESNDCWEFACENRSQELMLHQHVKRALRLIS